MGLEEGSLNGLFILNERLVEAFRAGLPFIMISCGSAYLIEKITLLRD